MFDDGGVGRFNGSRGCLHRLGCRLSGSNYGLYRGVVLGDVNLLGLRRCGCRRRCGLRGEHGVHIHRACFRLSRGCRSGRGRGDTGGNGDAGLALHELAVHERAADDDHVHHEQACDDANDGGAAGAILHQPGVTVVALGLFQVLIDEGMEDAFAGFSAVEVRITE